MANSRSLAVLLVLVLGGDVAASDPPASMAPRVVRGADLLTKTRVFDDARIGDVTDIRVVDGQDKEPMIVIAGTKGAAFLEPESYRVQRLVQYYKEGEPLPDHHVIDVNADGEFEFVRMPHAAADMAVLDDEGHVLWQRSPPGWGFPSAAFGDVDGDKSLEFLLCDSRNQELIGWDGTPRWKQSWEGNTSNIRFIDLNNDGHDELISIDGKSLFVRDKDGKLMRQMPIKDAHYVNFLEPTCYSFDEAGSRILLGYNYESGDDLKQRYLVIGTDGKIVVGDLPENDVPFFLTQCRAQLGGSDDSYRFGCQPIKYQGQLVGFSATRLQFCLYDDDRQTVYDEIIAAKTGESIPGEGDVAVVPCPGPEQGILVGYGPEAWEYRGKKSP